MKIAVFPGSFDPITKGHEDIILRALPMFDKIIVALGTNTSKKYMFSQEQRLQWLKDCFQNETKVEVTTYNELTVNYAKKVGASHILRGLRNSVDFEYEKSIAEMNKKMAPTIETIFLFTAPQYAAISSTIVRELIRNDATVTDFLPEAVQL